MYQGGGFRARARRRARDVGAARPLHGRGRGVRAEPAPSTPRAVPPLPPEALKPLDVRGSTAGHAHHKVFPGDLLAQS